MTQPEGADSSQALEEGFVLPVTDQGPFESTYVPRYSYIADLACAHCHATHSPCGRQDSLCCMSARGFIPVRLQSLRTLMEDSRQKCGISGDSEQDSLDLCHHVPPTKKAFLVPLCNPPEISLPHKPSSPTSEPCIAVLGIFAWCLCGLC